MNRVFVDTSGFYASLNHRDAHHRDATRLFHRAPREPWFLFTTNFVLAESHALILVRMGRDRAWNFLQAIITGSSNVMHAEEADERRARAIIEPYQDMEGLRKAMEGPRTEPAVWDKSLDRPLFPADWSA